MWFPFALLFALITSITVILAKKIMQETGEYFFLLVSNIFTFLSLFLLIIIFFSIPKVDTIFWVQSLAATILGLLGGVLAYRAIKIEDVSLVSPIAAFNPVFTALISLLILGEVISHKGWLGIGLICIGAYLLEISKSREGLLKPLAYLSTNKGVQLSFIAYFLWAITPTMQKIAIEHTNPPVPPFTSLIGTVVTVFLLIPLTMKFSSIKINLAKKYFHKFLLLGILGGVGQVAAMIAFSSTNLGFATAIFKLSILFTVMFGWLFFKEKNIKGRLLGSSVMLGGVILLVT